MRKILFVAPHLYGSIRLLADNVRYLDLSRFQVTILVLEPPLTLRDEFPEGVRIETIDDPAKVEPGGSAQQAGYPTKRSSLGVWARRFVRIWREAGRHDLVVSWSELTPTYVTAVAAALARKPVIGWVHIHLSRTFALRIRPGWSHRLAIRLCYPVLRRVVGCSRPVSVDLRSAFGLKNVTCISNTIDLERVRRLGTEEIDPDLREFYSQGAPVVINVAALEHQKGQEVLLRAHANLLAKGVDHRLVLVGEGGRRDALCALACELGVSETVLFAGFRRNPYALIAHASAMALSSHMEGFALVIAEALALGIPVVSTDCEAGPRELLKDGQLGLLVPVNDDHKLAEAMERVLSEAALRKQLAESRHGCGHVDASHSATEIESLFEQVLLESA